MSHEMGTVWLLSQLVSTLGNGYCISTLWNLGLAKYHFSEWSLAYKNPIHTNLT